MELRGVTALVTGGGRRLGRAIALGLAAEGVNLVLHYNRSSEGAESAAEEARDLGVEAVTVRGDLAMEPESILEGAGDLAPIRVLVNSAAVFPDDTIEGVSPADWDATLSVNLRAPVFLTQGFVSRLGGGSEGAVVNVTDWRTARPYRDHFSYTVAKGALDAFTLAAAHALAPRIRVNAVALGAILPPPGRDSAYLKELAQEIPLQRVGDTDSVVAAVVFLASNSFVTGEIVRIDGGAHLR